MTSTAIFPGTFDPVTLGHQDLIQRSLSVFDRLVIAVSQKQTKCPLLSIDDRMALLESLYTSEPSITVVAFDGLLVDFAKKQNASAIVRGIRNNTDATYEQQLAQMNAKLAPEVETVLLFAHPEYQMISSTWIREILANHGDIRPFVDPSIASVLQQST